MPTSAFMSSVPVVHPKLTLAEAFLDNFGSDHVLDSSADDLKDHWTHDDHEGERLRLLETLFATAKAKQLRVAIVSGMCMWQHMGSPIEKTSVLRITGRRSSSSRQRPWFTHLWYLWLSDCSFTSWIAWAGSRRTWTLTPAQRC